ncbi:hypothetical protein C8Q80DRAFT_1270804 [Daedaleopsis nitida]|nr:hypothetical protein C8Q80DRAFT_1270804 [Daedaleopsis nitida]
MTTGVPQTLRAVVIEETFFTDVDWVGVPGSVLGCDFSGVVVKVVYGERAFAEYAPEKASKEEWIGSSSTAEAVPLFSNRSNLARPLTNDVPTAVGQCAIRLASLSGSKVVSTASPRNIDLAKSLGASEIFDYRDPDMVSKNRKVTENSITKVLDTIFERSSQGHPCQSAFASWWRRHPSTLAIAESATP